MKRAGVYARVSTAEQTPENQLAPLRVYALARAWEVTEYVDHGVSGAKESRPALDALYDWDAMLAAARERAAPAPLVGCVLVRCRSHDCATTGNLWELPITETPAVTAPGWAFCSFCAGVLEPLRAYTVPERPGVWAELYAGSAASPEEPVRCGAYL